MAVSGVNVRFVVGEATIVTQLHPHTPPPPTPPPFEKYLFLLLMYADNSKKFYVP